MQHDGWGKVAGQSSDAEKSGKGERIGADGEDRHGMVGVLERIVGGRKSGINGGEMNRQDEATETDRDHEVLHAMQYEGNQNLNHGRGGNFLKTDSAGGADKIFESNVKFAVRDEDIDFILFSKETRKIDDINSGATQSDIGARKHSFNFFRVGSRNRDKNGRARNQSAMTSTTINQHNPSELVVIDYTARWCMACQGAMPKFLRASRKFPNTTFVVADIDGLDRYASEFAVAPTFCFYRDGQKVDELLGLGDTRSVSGYQTLMDRVWLHN